MENNTNRVIDHIFHVICLFLAIGLTCWCLHQYNLDDDITATQLRKYHETIDDIYPSISICVKRPFQEHKFGKYTNNRSLITAIDVKNAYRDFLYGDQHGLDKYITRKKYINGSWHVTKEYTLEHVFHSLQAIDYDDVTINLKSLISDFKIKIPNGLQCLDEFSYDVINDALVLNETTARDQFRLRECYHSESSLFHQPQGSVTQVLDELRNINTYISARQARYKCFTFDIPMVHGKQIREVYMRISGLTTAVALELSRAFITLTYPGQFLRSSRGNQIHLGRRFLKAQRPQCYKFEIFVGSMEVFRRRDKPKSRCNKDWRIHDEKKLKDIISLIN